MCSNWGHIFIGPFGYFGTAAPRPPVCLQPHRDKQNTGSASKSKKKKMESLHDVWYAHLFFTRAICPLHHVNRCPSFREQAKKPSIACHEIAGAIASGILYSFEPNAFAYAFI
jgi:hypothetical protein